MSTSETDDVTTTDLPTVLTPDDLAVLLRVRKRAVLDAIQRGELPGVRRVAAGFGPIATPSSAG